MKYNTSDEQAKFTARAIAHEEMIYIRQNFINIISLRVSLVEKPNFIKNRQF